MKKLSVKHRENKMEQDTQSGAVSTMSDSEGMDHKGVPALFLKPELEELVEYAQAVQEKRDAFGAAGKTDLYQILDRISTDMLKMIKCFKEERVSFDECYEELVSLYVFVELYFDIQPQN